MSTDYGKAGKHFCYLYHLFGSGKIISVISHMEKNRKAFFFHCLMMTGGSSQVSVTSETGKVDITAEGSSKLTLTGKATEMIVKGSRSSSVDAFAMPLETVEANLSNSSSVTVSVSKQVFANLVGGSSLYYSGTPEFRIEKIVKSTLAPYGTK